jgi:probable HAF family extracellular repeat protein
MIIRLFKQSLLGLVGAVVIALAVSMLTATTAATSFSYTITDLGTGEAHGINDRGQVVGVSYTSEGAHAFKWRNGTMTDLGTLGGHFSEAWDINNRGQVVGRSYISSSVEHAFLWEKGKMTDLGILPNLHELSQAYGLNNLGQVIGLSGKPGPFSSANPRHAFLWKKGKMTDLSIFLTSTGYSMTSALGINNRGQVVGELYNSSNQSFQGVLWDKGKITKLGTLGGNFSTAYDINDRGQVVGHSSTKVGTSHAFKWQNGKMTDLDTLGSFMSFAFAINNVGQVVGSGPVSNSIHAFLWANGKMLDLNNLIPNNSGWELKEAWDINNKGQIVGHGTHQGQTKAFLLTPTRITQ